MECSGAPSSKNRCCHIYSSIRECDGACWRLLKTPKLVYLIVVAFKDGRIASSTRVESATRYEFQ